MIAFSGIFNRDGNRPHGHGYVGTIKKIIEDVKAKGALTPPENALVTGFLGSAQKMAQQVKNTTWFSTNFYAVCHKIPYSAVERTFEKLMNDELTNPGANALAWSAFDELMNQVYYGNSHGHVGQSTAELLPLIVPGNEYVVAQKANEMLSDFDKDSDNLYFGFQTTNSSIGENHDYHYDVIGLSIGPVTATPRGAHYGQLLNQLESALGLTPSSAIEVVDSSGVKWQMTSGVHGTKSAGTGYIETV